MFVKKVNPDGPFLGWNINNNIVFVDRGNRFVFRRSFFIFILEFSLGLFIGPGLLYIIYFLWINNKFFVDVKIYEIIFSIIVIYNNYKFLMVLIRSRYIELCFNDDTIKLVTSLLGWKYSKDYKIDDINHLIVEKVTRQTGRVHRSQRDKVTFTVFNLFIITNEKIKINFLELSNADLVDQLLVLLSSRFSHSLDIKFDFEYKRGLFKDYDRLAQ